MKTRTFTMIAMAATLLTACDKNNEPDENYNGEIRLRSGIEVETRTFIPTQTTIIANREKVSVWVDDAKTPNAAVVTTENEHLYKANPFIADGSNGLTLASNGDLMYFPQTANQVNIFALHGNFTTSFSKGNDFPSVSGAEYSVENDQAETTMAHYTHSDLLYAYSSNVERTNKPVQLTFYHMLSKIELAILRGKGAPELQYSDAVKLNGVTLKGIFTPGTPTDMSSQTDRAGMLSATTNTSPTGNMTLGQTTSKSFETSDVTYNEAIVVPQKMKGKTLTFTLKDGGILTYTFGDVTFESGKKYQYHITLDQTGLEVTSTITDWDPITAVDGTATMQ